MTTYWMRPATWADVEAIVPRIRQADVDELWAIAMSTPADCLRQGLNLSPKSWVGLADDTPLCIFGVTPIAMLGAVGAPWMVGTDDIDQHARGFVKACRGAVQQIFAPYDHLMNFVDARNLRAIRWLKWLGFEIFPAEPMGHEHRLFHRFEMKREAHV